MERQSQEQIESFEEFCKCESIQELLMNLRGSRHKNRKPERKHELFSTQVVYSNRLYHLHKWLGGRKLEFNNFIHIGENFLTNEDTKYKNELGLQWALLAGKNYEFHLVNENKMDEFITHIKSF